MLSLIQQSRRHRLARGMASQASPSRHVPLAATAASALDALRAAAQSSVAASRSTSTRVKSALTTTATLVTIAAFYTDRFEARKRERTLMAEKVTGRIVEGLGGLTDETEKASSKYPTVIHSGQPFNVTFLEWRNFSLRSIVTTPLHIVFFCTKGRVSVTKEAAMYVIELRKRFAAWKSAVASGDAGKAAEAQEAFAEYRQHLDKSRAVKLCRHPRVVNHMMTVEHGFLAFLETARIEEAAAEDISTRLWQLARRVGEATGMTGTRPRERVRLFDPKQSDCQSYVVQEQLLMELNHWCSKQDLSKDDIEYVYDDETIYAMRLYEHLTQGRPGLPRTSWTAEEREELAGRIRGFAQLVCDQPAV